jgi:thiamine-phosphate pyrophosphorylase
MFAFKKKYFLIIETIKDIDLRTIKKHNKFIIIYRNQGKKVNIVDLLNFRKKCKLKSIKFFVANNINLSVLLKSDGIYLSAYNKSYKSLNLKSNKYSIIGSAHNSKEIYTKKKQGCSQILMSRLFLVDYKNTQDYMGLNKFNNHTINNSRILVPLGGIKLRNINKLKIVNSDGFAILSEIKKKPANIISRLF